MAGPVPERLPDHAAGETDDRGDAERREAKRRLRGKNLAMLFALIAWVALIYVVALIKFPAG